MNCLNVRLTTAHVSDSVRYTLRRHFFLLFIVFLSTVGCNSNSSKVTIFVSGDTKGWITPCGCAANQSGGLARRATLLKQAAAYDDVLYLDAGGSASGISEYHQMKLTAILRGDVEMGLALHNLGSPELLMSPKQLEEVGNEANAKWLSCNVASKSSDGPSISKIETFTKGKFRIAVAGVVDPKLLGGDSKWQAKSPIPALLDAFSNVKADVRIVLAYFDEDGLQKLAQELPEVDFIIGGPTGQAMTPVKIGRVQVLSGTNKGKFLARLRLAPDRDSWTTMSAEPIEVSSRLDEDRSQKRNLSKLLDDLAKRDFTVHEAGIVDRLVGDQEGYRIAGSESCEKCHAEDQMVWKGSKHGHAWEALVSKKSHVDPYCQQCHATGYGYEGGFVSVAHASMLVNVGCENCHGPSAAHVANPKIKTPFQSKDQCIRCHDHENSPSFKQDAYWTKVAHGKKNEIQAFPHPLDEQTDGVDP